MTKSFSVTQSELQTSIEEAVAKAFEQQRKRRFSLNLSTDGKLLNVNSALAFLDEIGYSISPKTIRNLVWQRRIPFSKHGNSLVFNKSKLREWAKSRNVNVLCKASTKDAECSSSKNA